MASEIDTLCRKFCRSLASLAGDAPQKWRPINVVGAQCRVYAPATLAKIVAHGAKRGWLLEQGGHSVVFTDEGHALMRNMRPLVRKARQSG